MKNFFTVLGGMGTLATESFIQVLNSRTKAETDQDYLNYLLVNHATVPDRTEYILDTSLPSPVEALIEDIHQTASMGPNFFVLTCNTAHTFFEEFQAETSIPILHMPRIAAKKVEEVYGKNGKKPKVALLGTKGTINSGVYEKEFEPEKVDLFIPDEKLQEKVMNLIYRDVKEKQFLNQDLFYEILEEAIVGHDCDVAVLGCTELSLMQEETRNTKFPVVDAQSELVNETIRLALEHRNRK